MNIAFFISNHGYGHIMRNLQVMKELLNRNNNILLVTAHRQIDIAKQFLSDFKFDVYDMDTDAGIVVFPGTLTMDTEATKELAKKHVSEFENKINIAKQLFADYSIDKVVVDIVPWALTAAKDMKIPSYFMASFTWLDQYKHFMPKEIYCKYEKAFGDADNIFMYELANAPTKKLFPTNIDVGFVAREFNNEKVKEIKNNHSKKIVFMAIGASNSGFDFEIDVSDLPYDFIITQVLKLKGDNVFYLPNNVENTQDYIKAADYCIVKAGWGTVAEVMLAGTSSVFLERPNVPEDTMIIEELKNRNEILSISVDELKNMKLVLEKMEKNIWKKTDYKNGYKIIADNICK